jgi:hypothetical protein
MLLSVLDFISRDDPDLPGTDSSEYMVALESGKPAPLPERMGLQLTRFHKIARID